VRSRFSSIRSRRALRDGAVVERVAAAVEREGADAWYTTDAQIFLGNAYDAAEWEKVTDIIEVWFRFGLDHAFVLEQRPELKWPPRSISKLRPASRLVQFVADRSLRHPRPRALPRPC